MGLCRPISEPCPYSMVCRGANCCKGCLSWEGDNPGGACLGTTLQSMNFTGASLSLVYVGGDQVIDNSDPTKTGPRVFHVTAKCDPASRDKGLHNLSFVDPGNSGEPHTAGAPWVYRATVSTSVLCGFSCPRQTDCRSCASVGCTWCSQNNTCLASRGTCSDTIKLPQFCPPDPCAKYSSCSTCAPVSNCFWCLVNSTATSYCASPRKHMSCPGGRINRVASCPINTRLGNN